MGKSVETSDEAEACKDVADGHVFMELSIGTRRYGMQWGAHNSVGGDRVGGVQQIMASQNV